MNRTEIAPGQGSGFPTLRLATIPLARSLDLYVIAGGVYALELLPAAGRS
ncbi:MAG: hypothetical protein ACRYGA_17125 [Janthinobacterium lividum]